MSDRPRTHYEGDGCDPPHKVTVIPAEEPERVRTRDKARLNLPRTRPGWRPGDELTSQRHSTSARDAADYDDEEVAEHGESSG